MGVEAALARRTALEAELAALQAELAEYQQIADDIPAIYEEKFRQQLQQLALELRRLMDEREALQQQIAALLPAAVSAPLSASRPVLPRLAGWTARWSLRRPHWRWLWASGAIVLAGAIGLAAWRRPLGPSPATPSPPAPASVPTARPLPQAAGAAPSLTLRAEGEAWLELQTLSGERLYVSTLQAGQQVRLPLPGPVRLRSGRPDLLQVSLDGRRFELLGDVADVDWHRVNPPAAPASSPAKAS